MKKALAAMTLVLALACNQKSTSTASSTPNAPASSVSANLTPEQLGEIGAEIKNHPSDAQKILTEHGLNNASFEKAIRDVSSDPAASKRYRDAYNKKV